MAGILLVAQIRLYRDGLAALLHQRAEFEAVATAADEREALSGFRECHPEVVLLDTNLPDSIGLLRELRRLDGAVPIVGLCLSTAELQVLPFLEAGMTGFVCEDGSFDDLLAAVRCAASGELHLSPKVAGAMMKRLAALTDQHALGQAGAQLTGAQLTKREREIAQLLGQSLSNKEIASRLGIEVATAKNHVHNLLEKLQLHRRLDVARLNLR